MNTILIVDDEPKMVKLLQLYLEHHGYRTVGVNSGEEAILFLEENRVQLVVMDVMMPKMDGRQVAKRIRDFYQIPILMVTALGTNQDIINSFNSGANGHIVKPVEEKTLMKHIQALINEASV